MILRGSRPTPRHRLLSVSYRQRDLVECGRPNHGRSCGGGADATSEALGALDSLTIALPILQCCFANSTETNYSGA